jgi:hypothetical protein
MQNPREPQWTESIAVGSRAIQNTAALISPAFPVNSFELNAASKPKYTPQPMNPSASQSILQPLANGPAANQRTKS